MGQAREDASEAEQVEELMREASKEAVKEGNDLRTIGRSHSGNLAWKLNGGVTRTDTKSTEKEVRLLKSHRTTPIFMDPDKLKAMVRGNMEKPAYAVEGFYHKTGLWQAIARHPRFEQLTLGVIMLNAVWIAIDTDRNDAAALLEAEPVFQVAEHFFCVFFSFEWLVRFMAFERKRNGLKDRWFVFDSCLVAMMVSETWILTTILLVSSSGGGGGASGLGNASILRLFRLLRLSRMARMLRSFPELMILIKGITAATRSVLLVMFLLVIFMYIFAIAFTQLAEDTVMGRKYFANVGTSMYSLLVYGTFLDNLSSVCMDIKNESPVCLGLFFIFVVFSALTLMNMLIGVLCEVVSTITATETEVRVVDFVTGKLEAILDSLDEDGDKRISRVEFAKILQIPEAVLALDEVGVDPVGIMDFADFIFDDAGAAGREAGGLAFKEFMDVVLKLRGSNTATVKDIVDLRRFIFGALEHFQSSLLRSDNDRPKAKMSLRRTAHTNSGKRASRKGSYAGPKDSNETISEGGIVEGLRADSPVIPEGSAECIVPERGASERSIATSSPKAMRRLQTRVERLEDSLATLLGEVRKMSARLPPAPPALNMVSSTVVNSNIRSTMPHFHQRRDFFMSDTSEGKQSEDVFLPEGHAARVEQDLIVSPVLTEPRTSLRSLC